MTLKTEIKADFSKFESWIKTLELKFFKGKLHQKVVSPNPGESPGHAWIPIAAHDVDAPAAGEPIATQSHDRREGDQDSDGTSSGQAPPVPPATGSPQPSA